MVGGLLAQAHGQCAYPSDDEVDRALEEEEAMEMSAQWRQPVTEAMPMPNR